MKILKFGGNKFSSLVREAVVNGNPILIEDCEELIDPGIDPLL